MSFAYTSIITVLSTPRISSLSDVPFSNGLFSMSSEQDMFDRYTFEDIISSSIRCDETSSRLKNCILSKHIIRNKTVIENEDQLRELLRNADKKRSVKKLVIEEGCGNEMKDDLELCGFENLESIVVKKNTLKNLNSLKISDNPVLKSIETEHYEWGNNSPVLDSIEIKDGEWSFDNPTGVFHNVKSVTIASTLMIHD